MMRETNAMINTRDIGVETKERLPLILMNTENLEVGIGIVLTIRTVEVGSIKAKIKKKNTIGTGAEVDLTKKDERVERSRKGVGIGRPLPIINQGRLVRNTSRNRDIDGEVVAVVCQKKIIGRTGDNTMTYN